jgi:hypothetical protein
MIFYFRIRPGAKEENVGPVFVVFRSKKTITFYRKIRKI